MRKCTFEDLQGLVKDHVCEGNGMLLTDAAEVYVEENEIDGNLYYSKEYLDSLK
jgi:hypothetical protein